MEICVITPDRVVAPFLRLTGPAATGPADRGNELAGVAFNPAGDRMYFSAQRAYDFGVTYEVARAVRRRRRAAAARARCGARPAASPALSVRAPRRVTLAQLRRGVAIEVRSAQRRPRGRRAALAAARDGAGAARLDVPARATSPSRARAKRVPAGPAKLRLKASPRTLARLRRRRSTATRLTVLVRAADGRVHVRDAQLRVRRAPPDETDLTTWLCGFGTEE